MSIDQNCGSLLNFGFAVATEQVYRKPHLSVIPVFLILDMHVRNKNSSLFLVKPVNAQHKIKKKTNAILVYGHVDILWTIKKPNKNYDFGLIVK